MPEKISSGSLRFLKKFVSGSWNIDENNSVTIDGSLDCSRGLWPDQKKLPRLNIESVTGDFNCSNNGLTSLANVPKHVGGSFRCFGNNLTSLIGSPLTVGLNFDCMYNSIRNLKGCTTKIPGSFIADFNELESLENGPKIVLGDYRVSTNKISSLKGSPNSVGGSFQCENNLLESLVYGPSEVGGLYNCSENSLLTLQGAPEHIKGKFICSNNSLMTLIAGPKIVDGDYLCHSNLLKDLTGFPNKIGSSLNCSFNQILSLEGLSIMNPDNLVISNNPISEKTFSILAKDVCGGVPFSVSLALSWDMIDYRDQENLSSFLDFLAVSDYILNTFQDDPVETTRIYERLPVHIKARVINEISKIKEDPGTFERSVQNVSDLMQSGIFDDI
jgi:hypothetical protein